MSYWPSLLGLYGENIALGLDRTDLAAVKTSGDIFSVQTFCSVNK